MTRVICKNANLLANKTKLQLHFHFDLFILCFHKVSFSRLLSTYGKSFVSSQITPSLDSIWDWNFKMDIQIRPQCWPISFCERSGNLRTNFVVFNFQKIIMTICPHCFKIRPLFREAEIRVFYGKLTKPKFPDL